MAWHGGRPGSKRSSGRWSSSTKRRPSRTPSSTQTRAVKKLQAGCRLAYSPGTPVENHLGDLWSLYDFCCPGLLGNAAQFKRYVKLINQRQDSQAFGALRRLVRPYLLRRLKTDPHIVPDLPDKTEMRAECGLSKRQAVLYGQAVADLEKRLEDATGMARRGLVLSLLMQLKQICNHPAQCVSPAAPSPRKTAASSSACGCYVSRSPSVRKKSWCSRNSSR